jgi:hypothetical protein
MVLSGCSVGVAGTPQAAPRPGAPPGRVLSNPDRITSTDGLGEPSTWDPCSVVNPQALPRFGPGRFAKPESLEYCLIEARTEKGTVEVEIGWLFQSSVRDLEGFPSQTRQGGLRVLSVGQYQGGCERLLVFDDGIALGVRAYPIAKEDDPQLCAVSEVVMDQVVTGVVNGNSSKIDFQDGSLGPIDPCPLVTADMLGTVPSLAKIPPESVPAKHTCRFDNEATDSLLVVVFEIGGMPDGDTGELVGERYLTKERFDDEDKEYSGCTVVGQHKPISYRSVPNLIERMSVHVYLAPGQGPAACDAAWAISGLLWKSLPPL